MTISYDKLIFGFLGIALGLFAASYISSVIFFALIGLNPDAAQPWSVWLYVSMFSQPALKLKLLVSLAAPHLMLLGIIISFFIKHEPEFGDARWANWQDIQKAGLFKKHGLILGKYKGKYLISDTPTHAMLIAPTRTGKGVGLVVPNLLNWPDSIICLDVKHENYKKTAGFRKAHGHEVYMWSPFDKDEKSHRYNPLDAISRQPHQKINDLQVIGRILIQDPSHGDNFWASEARALFVGLALYVIDNPDMPSTIGAVNRLLGAEGDLGDICRHIVKTHKELPAAGQKTLMSFANKAAKERSGVKSNLNEALHLWDSPVIDAATSASDFSISDLRKKRMVIYVGVLTGQIQTLSPLLRIFFEQVITLLSMKEPDETEPYKVLLMMDEFHMLGEMAAMTSAFTLLGGYNCRVMAVVQGLKWLDATYGRDKRDGILSCCAHQIFFSCNDLETAAYVSNSCGEKTSKAISTSQKKSFKYEPASKNISFRARPLISKEKVKQLPRHEEIIITESSYPVRARKIVYFKDKNFRNRILPPPEIPKLEIVENVMPHFDLPNESQAQKSEPDPNQYEMLIKKPAKDNANLTDSLVESEDYKPEKDFVNALIDLLAEEETAD